MITVKHFRALQVELGAGDYDLMLVGDGSGTRAGEAAGWACLAHYRPSGSVRVFTGSVSSGTNNYAELAPYLHALWVFDSAARKAGNRGPFRVLVVSDSELTVRCGDGSYRRQANLSLWAALDYFVASGYVLTWRHVPRNSNPVSKEADRLAGEARLAGVPQCESTKQGASNEQ